MTLEEQLALQKWMMRQRIRQQIRAEIACKAEPVRDEVRAALRKSWRLAEEQTVERANAINAELEALAASRTLVCPKSVSAEEFQSYLRMVARIKSPWTAWLSPADRERSIAMMYGRRT
jgi:hypothetical protein